MSAFAAQVVPGSSDWLTRRNYVIHDRSAAVTSENNGQLDPVTDSPPTNGYQLDYKFPSLVSIKRDPDDVADFFRSARRPETSATSAFECTPDSLPPSNRTLPADEFRQRRAWLAANGYHQDVESNGDYGMPDAPPSERSFQRSRLPGVDELIQFQNDVISFRGGAELNRRRRIAADEPVDLSLIEQGNLNGSYLPGWTANPHAARDSKDPFQKVLSAYHAKEEHLQAMRRRAQGEVSIRDQETRQRLVHGPPSLSPAVLMPTRDVPDTEDFDEQYQPRRLMFAERMYALKHGNHRGDVRGSVPFDVDQSNLIRTKLEPECRRPPTADLPRSSVSSNESPVNGERRRQWPLDSAAESSWRGRHQHRQTDVDGTSRSPPSDALLGTRDAANVRGDTMAANGGGGVETAEQRFQINNTGEGRCPMSELIQLYDVTMASRAASGSHQTGSDVRPTAVTRRTADGNEDVMTSPERSACGMMDEDSMNSGAKKYVCHICPFVGEEKESFDAHMKIHFDHWCPSCNYSSRTEGRLRCHIKMFHSKPEGAGNGDGANKKRQKNKITCRHCDFTTKIKEDLWLHMRQHIPAEKMLECPRCSFVTDLKHHLEYHLRSSHIGSKPYKCDKCTYRCFNQSMLNSHAKSHTNVYQFRCLNCTFAAKYCHALKVHIRRYGHQAAPVLNEDGSQPTDGSGDFALISRRGRPRGPRGHREMPRFRSVRARNQPIEHGLPTMHGSAGEFDETIPRNSSNTHNGFPEMGDQMFYPSVSGSMSVNRPEGGLFESGPGSFPSFSKIGARPVPDGHAPHLQFSTDLSGPVFPDRRDVIMPGVTPPRYSLPPQAIRDAEIDEYLERCRRYRRAALDEMETYSVQNLRGSEIVQPQSGTAQAVYSVGMDVPSPEPERAQCGDLPLDLTLATKPKMEVMEPCSKSLASHHVDEDTVNSRDAASSPDDYDHVFRRRRHFRDWLQSSRSEGQATFDESHPSCRQQSGDSEGVLKEPSIHVPDTDSLGRSARSSKSEELGEVDSPLMATDDRSMETLDTFARKLVTRRSSSAASSPSGSFEDDRSRSRSPCRDNAGVDEAGSLWVASGRYQCSHCEIDFHGSRTLHAIHMGYHSNEDPFQCNVCGERTKDRVAFFIHLARVAHN